MTTNYVMVENLDKKVVIVTAINIVSTILNSFATYQQYQTPIDAESSFVSLTSITIPVAIGSLGSSLYLKSNGEYNYLYLGLHIIPLATRTITYFID
jgi:hypothetical protein